MKDSDWEILYELYRNPNMTKVANLLYMTQPSLTKRLQHMESEFQVTIVNRTPKGLEFTEEGKFLGKQAEAYLEFLRKTKDKLKEFQENSEGVITIGSSYTIFCSARCWRMQSMLDLSGEIMRERSTRL